MRYRVELRKMVSGQLIHLCYTEWTDLETAMNVIKRVGVNLDVNQKLEKEND